MFFFKSKQIPLNEFFAEGFVDIHSHLLPGIDDGAKDLNDSISLIKKMSEYGVKKFITTPHILGDVYPNTPKIIREKLKLVQDELIKQGLNEIKIKAAAEYMLDENFLDLIENDKEILTLKDNFVLVEMSYYSPPHNLFDILFKLGLKGYKPVLAHPERYVSYHGNNSIYTKLKNAGCLFQLNLLSLTKNYGIGVQKTSEKLLKENLYDFVGSDVHHHRHLNLLKEISNIKTFKKIESIVKSNHKFLFL